VTVYAQSSSVIVNFFGGRSTDTGATKSRLGDVSADVVGAQVRLTRAPAETGGNGFSLTLVPRNHDYLEEVSVGDWVSISMSNGEVTECLMLGVVDLVNSSVKTASTGAVESVVTIAGRDWSKVLAATEMVYDTFIGSGIEKQYLMLEAAKWMNSQKGVKFSPSEFVEFLLPLYLGGSLPKAGGTSLIRQFLVPTNGENVMSAKGETAAMAGTLLNLKLSPTRGKAPLIVQNTSQNLLSMLREVSHPILNELWYETDPKGLSAAKPFVATMREYPYARDAFSKLDNFSLSDAECMSVSLGAQSADTYNWFRLRATGGIGDDSDLLQGARPGVYVKNSIQKFGLRRYEAATPFAVFADSPSAAPSSSSSRATVVQVVEQWVDLITSWYALAYTYRSGQFICRFRPDIRPGRRLDYSSPFEPHQAGKYYIDAVTHNFTYPGAATTSVIVSRGVASEAQLDRSNVDSLRKWAGYVRINTTALTTTAGVATGGAGAPTEGRVDRTPDMAVTFTNASHDWVIPGLNGAAGGSYPSNANIPLASSQKVNVQRWTTGPSGTVYEEAFFTTTAAGSNQTVDWNTLTWKPTGG
jgi:hypothetical protein